MAYIVKIGANDRTSKLEIDSLSWSTAINSRAEASFTMIDTTGGTLRPQIGQHIDILDDAIKLFAGFISSINEVRHTVTTGSYRLIYQVSVADMSFRLDRRLVAKAYDAMTLKQIVDDINANVLLNDGLTTGGVETGPTIERAVFAYRRVSDVFDDLSTLTGYAWWVDESHVINFKQRSSVLSPFTLDESKPLAGSVSVSKALDEYRNVQIIRAGQDKTSTQTLEFVGDGVRRVFVVAYPIATVPTVQVKIGAGAYATKTLGIRGLDTGFDWYWSKNTNEISQDSGGVLLTSADRVKVDYVGFFPVLVSTENITNIADRVAVEGGSGRYEHIIEDASMDSVTSALARSDALLRRYGTIGATLLFDTYSAGLRAGQLITVSLPTHAISGSYLIESVRCIPTTVGTLYTVKALSGETIGGWQAFFKKLSDSRREFVLNENDVLIKIVNASDTITFTDSIATSGSAIDYVIGTALIGYSQVW